MNQHHAEDADMNTSMDYIRDPGQDVDKEDSSLEMLKDLNLDLIEWL